MTVEWTFVNERECVYERDRFTKTDRQADTDKFLVRPIHRYGKFVDQPTVRSFSNET